MMKLYKLFVNDKVRSLSTAKKQTLNLARKLNTSKNDVVLKSTLVQGNKMVGDDVLASSPKGKRRFSLDKSLRDW